MNIVLNKKTNIRLTCEKPYKFCHYSFPVYLFGSEKWKSLRKIISTLGSEETIGNITIGSIHIFDSCIENTTSQIEVLIFAMISHGKKDKRSKMQKVLSKRGVYCEMHYFQFLWYVLCQNNHRWAYRFKMQLPKKRQIFIAP